MKRTPICPDWNTVPSEFHPFLKDATLYDSSCSADARVIFIDRDGGYFLKSAPRGTLKTEAELTRYFHSKGLGAEVLESVSDERDWMLSARVPGEDCTDQAYLDQPERLCDLLATRLRALHEMDASDCPVPNRTETYLATVDHNYRNGIYDASLFPDNWGYASAEEAWRVVCENRAYLKTDVLLHGDYCLPNVILDDWRFSGFIDLGNGGIGDRHIDLFWGMWTLNFNLKTDRYRERFLDAYGRDSVEPDMLRVIAAMEVFG
ncbi:MAG: aminoglycoside 3'-phosphotransferase [Clostridia bacterium]|nr:aminoglycoside 3'-phosphotransferase [Clostridia bacterium]